MIRALTFGFRRLGAPLAWLTLGAIVATTAAVHVLGNHLSIGRARSEGDALWLHLPCLALTASWPVWLCSVWPPIGRGRAGAQAIRRLARGPLDGAGGVLAGGTLALALCLLAAGAGWSVAMAWTGRPLPEAATRVAVRFEPLAAFVDHPLRGRLERPQAVAGLDLRITYLSGTGGALVNGLRFWADGQPLGPARVDVDVVRDIVHLAFEPRAIDELTLEVLDGPPLTVRDDHASARGPGGRAAWQNAARAALGYAPLGLLAAAAVVALRRRVALPLARVLGLAIVLVGALVGSGGSSAAIAELGAGTWVEGSALWRRAGLVLGAGVALLAAASAASTVASWLARRR